MTEDSAKTRKLLFISHATPEDNNFVLWLASRLASAGYLVWSDLTKLVGGETHWDDISAAIREQSAKFVSVCSTAAFPKNGWKDELSLALSVERSQSLRDFVIPIRIDATPWGNFPVEIIRRNGIDFTAGWPSGLSQLLKKLKVDGVPKAESIDTAALSKWSISLLNTDGDIQARDETLISNVLEVVDPPKSIFVSRLLHGASVPDKEAMRWPAQAKGNLAYSFARLERSEDGIFAPESQILVSEFVTAGDLGRGVSQQEAFNIVTNLLRQQVSTALVKRGLVPHTFSNGRVGHFLPATDGAISPRVKFTDPWGSPESRALNGYSTKNQVFWHFAPELYVQVGQRMTASCHAHVVFTVDGRQPVDDDKFAHRLRRRFCKNWWQDRWRGMMLAYLKHLSSGDESFTIALSDSVAMSLSLTPSTLVCPVTAIAPESGADEGLEEVDIGTSDEDCEDDEDEAEWGTL